ncbi:hypothetical protein BLNAU_16955 [Blattamonas nauphoetae]|uniref:Uncharacterized protein n=1 Tax=Blattamonas nauphoetae TaxID=2049346 RepID=A0ABQ9XA13_9EUKA|nr:hypothetical protein BLNAU_16955 [Blattamonas nauphoetae]
MRPHVSPIPSSALLNLNNIIKPSFDSELSDSRHSVSLPDGVVHSHDYALISSSFVIKGQQHTSLRYQDASCDRKSLIAKEGNSPPSNEMHSLFNLQNASLSVVDVVLDLSSVSIFLKVNIALILPDTTFSHHMTGLEGIYRFCLHSSNFLQMDENKTLFQQFINHSKKMPSLTISQILEPGANLVLRATKQNQSSQYSRRNMKIDSEKKIASKVSIWMIE